MDKNTFVLQTLLTENCGGNLNMIKTRRNQSIYDLTDEFITAMQKMKSGGQDGEDLCKYFIQLETEENNPEVQRKLDESLKSLGKDLRKIDFILRMGLDVSDACVAFFTIKSRHNPQMLTALLGFYGLFFYKDHPRTEKLTLKWVFGLTGYGKLVAPEQFFWWYAATKINDTESVFDHITPEEYYRYQNTIKQ